MNWVTRPWRSAVATVGLAIALGWSAPEVQALAVGRITVLSALGQPLRAEVDILNIDAAEAASLTAGIAPAEAFRAAGMEYHALLRNLRVTIVRRSDGRTVLELSSDRPVNDPFIDLILETTWATGRLQRGYTLLFDPPKLPAPEPAVTTAPQISPAPAAEPVASPPASPAPAVVPAQATQAERKGGSAAARQITVQPGDTAGRIAGSNKPAELSLDQMLVAMLRANPDAFIGGNMNRLRAGAVLNIPAVEQAAAIPRGEARQVVIAQSQDFSEFRRKLAETTPATQATGTDRQSVGSVKAKVEDKKPSATTPDKLTLSKGTTQAAADKAARERQAKESAARVAELSKNIADLTKMKGALAPASAAAGSAVSGAGTATTTVTAITTPAAPAPSPAASPPAAAVGPTVVVAQAPAVAPKPAPAPEPTWIDQLLGNPQVLGAGALVLLLLGAAAVMVSRRRKAADEEPGSLLESRLQPESSFKASAHDVDTRAEPAGSSMMYRPSQLDTGGDVDPVAEADVYLAYGRDIQAEEILREAMRLNPTRLAIHLKLLEIFAKRRDLKAFAVVAKEALELSHGEGPEWTAISKLGRQLDPTDPMFQEQGSSLAPVAAVPAPTAVSAKQDAVRAQVAAAEKEAAAAIESGAAATADVDLDLHAQFAQAQAESGSSAQRPDGKSNLDARAAGAVKSKEPAEPSASEVQDLMISLDLDAAPAVPAKATESKAAAPAAAAGMIEFDLGELSLDLDSPQPGPDPAQAEVADDALTTKLALAEEFQAIGDDDGARHLLREVIAEASGDVKSRAQQALAKLG